MLHSIWLLLQTILVLFLPRVGARTRRTAADGALPAPVRGDRRTRRGVVRAVIGGMALAALAIPATLPTVRASTPVAGDARGALVFDGLTRTYLVHLPPAARTNGALPLLLAFHGSTDSGAVIEQRTGLDGTADRDGFVVVYPDADGANWNAVGAGVDDVGFVRALIGTLAAQYPIDQTRVYAAGFSDGAFFAQRLACEATDRIAAVASVAGGLFEPLASTCHPARPIPVLAINGTTDLAVPYAGKLRGGTVLIPPVQDLLQRWATRDACLGTDTSWTLPDRAHDGTLVYVQTYDRCQDGVAVTLYTIVGGGHTWPGGEQYLPVPTIGRTSHQVDADTVIWNFVRQYALNAGT